MDFSKILIANRGEIAIRVMRAAMPNHLLQILLRGANGVGFTTNPDNVMKGFVAYAVKTGIDVFRVFDSLNQVENVRVAMDAVNEAGRICEGTI